MHNDFYKIHLEDSKRRSERWCPSYRCDHCKANLLHVGPWGWPHFCKEIQYQAMPVLRFLPFDGDGVQ